MQRAGAPLGQTVMILNPLIRGDFNAGVAWRNQYEDQIIGGSVVNTAATTASSIGLELVPDSIGNKKLYGKLTSKLMENRGIKIEWQFNGPFSGRFENNAVDWECTTGINGCDFWGSNFNTFIDADGLSTYDNSNYRYLALGSSVTTTNLAFTGLRNTVLMTNGSGVVISTTIPSGGGGVSLSSTNTWTAGQTFTSSMTVNSSGTVNGMSVVGYSANYGTNAPGGGAFETDCMNTTSQGNCSQFYSHQGTQNQLDAVVSIVADNPNYMERPLYIQDSGTANTPVNFPRFDGYDYSGTTWEDSRLNNDGVNGIFQISVHNDAMRLEPRASGQFVNALLIAASTNTAGGVVAINRDYGLPVSTLEVAGNLLYRSWQRGRKGSHQTALRSKDIRFLQSSMAIIGIRAVRTYCWYQRRRLASRCYRSVQSLLPSPRTDFEAYISSASGTPILAVQNNGNIFLSTATNGLTKASTFTFTSSSSGILGVTDASAANSGIVGEVMTSSTSNNNAKTLATTVTLAISTVTLTPGNWEVYGKAGFLTGTATTVTQFEASISTTTGRLSNPNTRSVPDLATGQLLEASFWDFNPSTTLGTSSFECRADGSQYLRCSGISYLLSQRKCDLWRLVTYGLRESLRSAHQMKRLVAVLLFLSINDLL